ncbi:carbon storage regulator, partial [uncultured Clostridium sp.]
TVKLSINAPKEIQILRKELYIEVQNENKEAVSSNIDVLKKIKIKND